MKVSRWLAWPMLLVLLMFGPALAAEGTVTRQRAPEETVGRWRTADEMHRWTARRWTLSIAWPETLVQAQGQRDRPGPATTSCRTRARRSRSASGAGSR